MSEHAKIVRLELQSTTKDYWADDFEDTVTEYLQSFAIWRKSAEENEEIDTKHMKKILIVLCAIVFVAGLACCQNAKQIFQQARLGDAEAYKSLAICYRDGVQVDKSWLNMFCMYEIYCDKTCGKLDGIIDLLDEGHPFRLLTEVIFSSSSGGMDSLLVELREVWPVEAEAVEAAMELYTIEDESVVMKLMRKLEDKGSELAVVWQWIYYDEASDKKGQEKCYIRLAKKYPAFNLLLGDIYLERYDESDDFSDVLKAIDYYYKADAYGMLGPTYANRLLGLYDYYGKKSMLRCDDEERIRLENITKWQRNPLLALMGDSDTCLENSLITAS